MGGDGCQMREDRVDGRADTPVPLRRFLHIVGLEWSIERHVIGQVERFLERVDANEMDPAASSRHLFRESRWRMHDYWFGEALGELRAGVGLQVAIIAASYGLDVEDDLARTLPDPVDD